jgi:hypothetical protein
MSARSTALVTLFVGPMAAAASLLVNYFLAYPTRPGATNAPLFVVTAVAAVLTFAGLFFACRAFRERDELPEVDRFLVSLSIGSNVFFLFVVLVGYGLPPLVLRPTD